MRYAVDLDHRLPAGEVIRVGEIDERAFGTQFVGDAAFQHELGLGGHTDTIGAGRHRRRRERLRDAHFVHAGRRRHGCGQQHVRRQPDADGDRETFWPRFSPGGSTFPSLHQPGRDARSGRRRSSRWYDAFGPVWDR